MLRPFIYLTIISIVIQAQLYSQETEKISGIFYKASLATTISVNENYEIFDEDSGTFFVPNSIFVNNTIGYQFDTRSMLGLNIEYNYHGNNRLNFLPIHLSFQYNVLQFEDNLFLRGSYGRLVGISKDFETGTFYRVGAGYQVFDANFKNSWHFGIDFTRKRFGFRQTEKLSSVSIFLEFMLF
jgi:hypothetical protein